MTRVGSDALRHGELPEVDIMSGAIDPGLRKFHASLNVSDVPRAIAFYRVLLGAEPAKVRSDYAKFDIAEPPLVLSLVPKRPGAGGHLNHAGLRMRSAEELVEVQQRLEAAGITTRREDGVECCYARQTKFWVTDPDGALWEIYVFHEDVDDHDDDAHADEAHVQAASASAAATQSWEHHLQESMPARIPHDDNTLHEVRFSGSINAAPESPGRETLLAEGLRVLRPEAVIRIHGLAGDRRCSAPIALPGPAAAVQHVPAVSDVAEELARAGFVDITIEKLSQTAYFVVDGVPMRELRMVARKPGYRPRVRSHQAIYLGPMSEVADDFGAIFRRGVPAPMNIHDWQMLAKSTASSSFLFLEPERVKESDCARGAENAHAAVDVAQ
jgi:catechol 2,3-dioxygenase-like lactoylglutathione lyase family enzyme